jgi:hypothetical protein
MTPALARTCSPCQRKTIFSGEGTGYKPAPAKGYNAGKGTHAGAPLQHTPMASTSSATAAVAEPVEIVPMAEPVEATTTAVAEPVEAQTTKANNHAPGAGADLQSVPTKDHLFRWRHGLQARASERAHRGKGRPQGVPLQHFPTKRRGAPARAPFPACAPRR